VRRGPLIFVVLLLLVAPASASYEEGAEAYNRGDYTAAFVEWRASAPSSAALGAVPAERRR